MGEAACRNEYLYSLLRYIENNVSAELDAGLLSGAGCVSRRKLYYDFYSLSGHSVKEYVRKRRLSNALALIKMSGMELTDVAFRCGYASYLTLWRAVKQTLGLSPSEYKNGNTYYFFPPFNGRPLQSVLVSNETIPAMRQVSFYHTKLSNIEDTAVNTFLRAFPDYGGRIFGRNGKQRGGGFCYELYLTEPDREYGILTFHGFEIGNVNPGMTAAFAMSTVRNDECKISAAWDYLYAEWLQNSMFEYTGEPYYEEYILKRVGNAVLSVPKLKLCLPIRERREEPKITLTDNPRLHFITAAATGCNAEEIASRTVIGYVSVYYPYILNASNGIYLRKDGDACVCGFAFDAVLPASKDGNVAKLSTTEDRYLVLESGVTGDYDRYADMLFAFVRDNGMDADRNSIFAVYDASNHAFHPKIKMYCPVKLCTK